jgi:hypothetical protein
MSEAPKDDAPAFPVTAGQQVYATGMTLRDWFAGQAMAGVCRPAPDGWSLSPQDHATWAYQVADAMLEARK